ncbi:MAG: SDR family NAD(P)-dependent oxidoreductase [Pseudomonadota bacterium]
MKTVLVTGSAGFIGYHLSKLLLAEGFRVVGYDNLNPYYDVSLKERRHAMLLQSPNFSCTVADLEDMAALAQTCQTTPPDVIVHLAAQAGVRYSLEVPRDYINSNVVGTFNVMEMARDHRVAHLLMSSTSSAYGANTEMPFRETDKSDTPLTIYAATKRAMEGMGHAYAHLHGLPTTLFRFFTVYGPWGRPDMALFKFTEGILAGRSIDIYNHGKMERDFTYVDDLVRAIRLLIDTPPPAVEDRGDPLEGDSLSPAAPYRLVNIGNSSAVPLMDFVAEIEDALGIAAIRNYTEMQPGEVVATWADGALLTRLTGYAPGTDVRTGVRAFVAWYRDYYGR